MAKVHGFTSEAAARVVRATKRVESMPTRMGYTHQRAPLDIQQGFWGEITDSDTNTAGTHIYKWKMVLPGDDGSFSDRSPSVTGDYAYEANNASASVGDIVWLWFVQYDESNNPVYIFSVSTPLIRWAMLAESWSKPGWENGDWPQNLTANPCDEDGLNVDTSTDLSLYYPKTRDYAGTYPHTFMGWVPDLAVGEVVAYLPWPDQPGWGIIISPNWTLDHDRTWFEFADGFTNRDGDTIYRSLLHREPWTADPNSHEFDVVTNIETEDDMTSWGCGHIRVYYSTMEWDSRGHMFNPGTFGMDDQWADQY